MTVEEALVLFPGSDSLEDQLDEQLFGFKQFFLTKPILTATFKSRLVGLLKIDEAVKVLRIEIEELDPFDSPNTDFSPLVEMSVLYYFDLIAAQKLKIAQSKTPGRLIHEVNVMLQIHIAFCAIWVGDFQDVGDVLLSKPIDEVEFIQSVKRCSAKGLMTFHDLKKANLSDEPLLLKEMKRLSLQYKKELEWTNDTKS